MRLRETLNYHGYMQKIPFKKLIIPSLTIIFAASALSACSGTKVKAEGKLKKTDYCAFYREFEEKVPTAQPKEQLKLFEKIAGAKDFPASLKKDYDQIISSYKKSIAGKPVSKDEKKNEAASKRMQRHAIENCEILKSNNSSGGGI